MTTLHRRAIRAWGPRLGAVLLMMSGGGLIAAGVTTSPAGATTICNTADTVCLSATPPTIALGSSATVTVTATDESSAPLAIHLNVTPTGALVDGLSGSEGVDTNASGQVSLSVAPTASSGVSVQVVANDGGLNTLMVTLVIPVTVPCGASVSSLGTRPRRSGHHDDNDDRGDHDDRGDSDDHAERPAAAAVLVHRRGLPPPRRRRS